MLTATAADCTATSTSSSPALSTPQQRLDQQAQGHRPHQRRAGQQQPAPVEHVGQGAAPQREHQQRYQAGHAQVPDPERASGSAGTSAPVRRRRSAGSRRTTCTLPDEDPPVRRMCRSGLMSMATLRQPAFSGCSTSVGLAPSPAASESVIGPVTVPAVRPSSRPIRCAGTAAGRAAGWSGPARTRPSPVPPGSRPSAAAAVPDRRRSRSSAARQAASSSARPVSGLRLRAGPGAQLRRRAAGWRSRPRSPRGWSAPPRPPPAPAGASANHGKTRLAYGLAVSSPPLRDS